MANIDKKKEISHCVTNTKIISKLQDFVSKHPEMRFMQMLHHLDLVSSSDDRYYEPSEKSFERMKDEKKRLKASLKRNKE